MAFRAARPIETPGKAERGPGRARHEFPGRIGRAGLSGRYALRFKVGGPNLCGYDAIVLTPVKGWVLAMLGLRPARGSAPGFAAFALRCARRLSDRVGAGEASCFRLTREAGDVVACCPALRFAVLILVASLPLKPRRATIPRGKRSP